MAIEAVLKELADLLYGSNYAVFLRLYQLPYSPETSAKQYIAQALGPAAIVGGSSPVTGREVLAEVEEALRYAGDSASGPRPEALRSKEYKDLLGSVLAHVEQAASGATLIQTFWLRDGHPAYPVFWDFAFVLAGPSGAEILIGSSSD